ncbi:hypothetical protein [Diaphorobacter caeni]|uniref:hypothetical protein n=1 Tax=Diaphorobacter caeni TaxID=2784387 RepID=UPI00188FABBE|nr:hypothetical protein [Diaphorobacter caeni]MBF5004661.1 hypothetical protein [Diaphorobacter caeni]
MTQKNTLRALFWLALVAFLAWDYAASPKVDLRFEAPLIAAGSGQAASGGHCSMPAGK